MTRSPSATPRLAPSITSSRSPRPATRRRWATLKAHPVPEWTMDPEVVGKALSSLGKDHGPGLIAHAKEMGVTTPTRAG